MSQQKTYLCWLPDQGETEDDARPQDSMFDADWAASAFAENYWWENAADGPAENLDVDVKAPDGTITHWTVTPEHSIHGNASRRTP